MRIGILGSGRMGGTLGVLFAQRGHHVRFSYARTPAKLTRLARRAGHGAVAATPREAVADADAVLLAVHWSKVPEVLRQTGPLAGQVVITCSLPMDRTDTHLVVAHTRSGAETLARRLPRARVVSAFGSVPSEVFPGVFAARGRHQERPSLVVAGDDAAAKRLTARLVRDIGFTPVDVGPLRTARTIEPFALLMATIAYEGRGGPAVAYRFARYR